MAQFISPTIGVLFAYVYFRKSGTLKEELKALKEKLGEQQSLAFSAGKIIGKVMSVFRVR